MKIAVITGASSGMGWEMARAIDKSETLDEIWLIARRRERLEELAKELRTPARVLALDLSLMESYEKYRALLAEVRPEIVTLGNVSGYGKFALFEETPYEDVLGIIDVNDKAYVAMTHISLPYMKRGARILNLDSLSAFQPVPYQCIYGASKAFVLSFSRSLNVELEPRGIRVLAICPGWVKTEFFDRAVIDSAAVTYYDHWWTPEQVISQALADYDRGRDVSVLGAQVRRQVVMVKHLSHRIVMKIWMKQQKHDKRPDVN